jgi:hypothetical protein
VHHLGQVLAMERAAFLPHFHYLYILSTRLLFFSRRFGLAMKTTAHQFLELACERDFVK